MGWRTLCSRPQIVIPGLLRWLRDMESNYERQLLEVQKRESRKWRFRVVVVCLFWLVVYVYFGLLCIYIYVFGLILNKSNSKRKWHVFTYWFWTIRIRPKPKNSYTNSYFFFLCICVRFSEVFTKSNFLFLQIQTLFYCQVVSILYKFGYQGRGGAKFAPCTLARPRTKEIILSKYIGNSNPTQ